jgi:hypothetical protein
MEGNVVISFNSVRGQVTIQDMYPRRIEQIQDSDLEVGLASDITWSPLNVSVNYRTRISRINTTLFSGGICDSLGWWRFQPRKGEDHIEGTMETLMILQSTKHCSVIGKAQLSCRLPWLERDPGAITLPFRL